MLDWFVRDVLGFVHQFGYVAVFVYMALETAFILHFVPSEVVVPLAASQLVHDGPSFALFVTDATAGATTGSVIAYELFGRFGREALDRYGHVLHVSEGRIDRSQRLFVKYGESSVFWGRLLPFFRAFISIPAGLAEMGRRRFVLYSAAGAALFNTGLTYLVYTGQSTASPMGYAAAVVGRWVGVQIQYVRAHPRLVLVGAGVAVLVLVVLWANRTRITANPRLAGAIALHVIRALGLLVGALFVLGALSSPHQAFAAITWAWDDPRVFVHLGATEQVALLLTGVLLALLGVLLFEVGQLVSLADLDRLRTTVRERWSR